MKKKTANIPYVPVVGFEKAIQVHRNAKAGDPFDKTALERRGVSGNTYYQVVNAMKFLKIIDQKKIITDNLNLWLEGKEGRLKVVQAAYKPLLSKLKLPAKDNIPIKKTIKELYKMADSVVLLATTFFIWAARQGGINVLEGDQDGIPRRGRGAKPGLPRRRVGRPPRGAYSYPRNGRGLVGPAPVVFNVNLQIGKETTRDDIHRMLSDLKEELSGF